MPEQAGADRLCNAVALSQLYGAPAVSVDFGTSTNFDVLSAEDDYIGGVIAPGHPARARRPGQPRRPAAQSRARAAAQAIGRNTAQAMQSGLFWGYAGLVESLLRRILAQLDSPATRVVATGGLAPVFQNAYRLD